MTARDDLAKVISPYVASDSAMLRATDAVIADGWRPPARVIETREQLEALPIGVAIRSNESGQIATRIDDPGFGASSIHYFSVSGDKSVWFIGGVAALLPATVLWESGDPR